jgi:hypothetical protein
MIFTKENINNPESGALFWYIIKIIDSLIGNSDKDGPTLYGEIMKDYIIPCEYHGYDWRNYSSMEMIVNKYGPINFTNIRINIMCENDSGILKEEFLELIETNPIMGYKRYIKFAECDVGHKYVYSFETIYKNIMTINIHARSFRELDGENIFTIDIINFANDNYVIYFDKILDEWAINTVPKLVAQKCVKNLTIRNQPYRGVFIDYVINEFMNKKLTLCFDYIIKVEYYENMVDRILEAYYNNYTIESSKFNRNRLSRPIHTEGCDKCTNKEPCESVDGECSICKEVLYNVPSPHYLQFIVTQLDCSHVFHIKCLSKWTFRDISSEIEIKCSNTCPLCRAHYFTYIE